MKTIITICSALLLSMGMINITYAGNCGGTPCIKSVDIIDGSILSKDLAPKTVSGVQIRNGAIFPNKLASSAKPAGVALGTAGLFTIPATIGATTSGASVAITIPAPGNVVVRCTTGWTNWSHATGTKNELWIGIDAIQGLKPTLRNDTGTRVVSVDASRPTANYREFVNTERTFVEPTAGIKTYYCNVYRQSGADVIHFEQMKVVALYFPAAY